MKTLIQLTDDDLLLGCMMDSDNCPLARAINRALATGYTARVGRIAVEIVTYDVSRRLHFGPIALPERAQDFITAFDGEEWDYTPFADGEREELLTPFEFELELPAEVLAGEGVLV